MDFIWIFVIIIIGAYVFLNVMCSTIIKSSEIHDDYQKQKLIIKLWAIPLIGVFVVVKQINKDIKINQERIEDEIAPAIREVADRLKVLDADLKQQKNNKNIH